MHKSCFKNRKKPNTAKDDKNSGILKNTVCEPKHISNSTTSTSSSNSTVQMKSDVKVNTGDNKILVSLQPKLESIMAQMTFDSLQDPTIFFDANMHLHGSE